jgi:putative transcriptional regulator
MIDFNIHNTLIPSTGKILLAEPFMQDDYFARAVILLCHHDEESTFGFVLNHYVEVDITDSSFPLPKIESKISIGGPVEEQSLFFIHNKPDIIKDSAVIVGNLYMGGKFEDLKSGMDAGLIKQTDVRFFLGYSGWSPGQLDEELKEDAWLVSDDIDTSLILDTHHQTLWKTLMERQEGHDHMVDFPVDPQLN